jgi:hypothetical protein
VIIVIDDFLADPEAVRQSALRAGFGTWRPNKGDTGLAFYDGVSFWGDHATLFKALHKHLQHQLIPGSMFFRLTNPSMEHAIVHSDREYGDYTAIVYLSEDIDSNIESGTGFYKHRETGMIDLPPIAELMKNKESFEKLNKQIMNASDTDWELYKFVEGKFNRCLVFDAPKIHCRLPKTGYGTQEDNSRMVWVCHFSVP